MTSFTWLDYSEHERRQAMDVIDLFGEDETRDELGLGTIRDGFADLLFPGTSTIQTRAVLPLCAVGLSGTGTEEDPQPPDERSRPCAARAAPRRID